MEIVSVCYLFLFWMNIKVDEVWNIAINPTVIYLVLHCSRASIFAGDLEV